MDQRKVNLSKTISSAGAKHFEIPSSTLGAVGDKQRYSSSITRSLPFGPRMGKVAVVASPHQQGW